MTLRSQIAADRDAVFLDTDGFAEQVTYLPAAGGSREVTVIVEEEGMYAEREDDLADQEILNVLVGRDPTSARGAVDDPKLGDAILRSDGNKYLFSGEVRDAEDDAWWLTFKRKRTFQSGIEQQRSP